MSVVNAVMLHVDLVEDGVPLDQINRWFAEQRGSLPVDHTDADAAWGGGKATRVRIYAGALNFLRTDELIAFQAALPWEFPESVQLLVSGEHDGRFAACLLDSDRTWQRLGSAGGPD